MSCREKVHDFKIGTNFSSKHSKIQNQLEIVLFGSKRLQFKSNVCVSKRWEIELRLRNMYFRISKAINMNAMPPQLI